MEWLAAEPILADYAFVAGQSATTGVGLYELNELRQWAVNKGRSFMSSGKRLRSGRVVTPNKKARIDNREGPTMAPTQGMTLYRANGRRRYANRLGRKVGSYATRRHTIEEPAKADIPDKQVHWDGLVFVPRLNATEDPEDILNKRSGKNANVRGVKFQMCFQLNNIYDTPGPPATSLGVNIQQRPFVEPIKLRWAVVNPKDQVLNTAFNNGAPPDFFVTKNPTGTSMTEDFPVDGSHWKLMNRKINREKYNVLKEGAFMLHNQHEQSALVPNAVARLSPTSYKKISVYIPINKQMQFNSADGTPEYNMYFIFWYCVLNSETGTASYTQPCAIEYNSEKTTYFKNSIMYR